MLHDRVGSAPVGDDQLGPCEQTEFRLACRAQLAAIVEALEARDAPAIREAMLHHIREACADMVGLMSEADPGPTLLASGGTDPAPAGLQVPAPESRSRPLPGRPRP
jgi:hypothetical protein